MSRSFGAIFFRFQILLAEDNTHLIFMQIGLCYSISDAVRQIKRGGKCEVPSKGLTLTLLLLTCDSW